MMDEILFNELLDHANNNFANRVSSVSTEWIREVTSKGRSLLSAREIGQNSIEFTCNKTQKTFTVEFVSNNREQMKIEIEEAVSNFWNEIRDN